MKYSYEGKIDQFWEGIVSASQAAQKAGIHRESSEPDEKGCELQKEMRRRVFCSLYILDSYLSRQLDRIPFLQEYLVAKTLPRMHLVPNSDYTNGDFDRPDMFTERLLQVRLARFWSNVGPKQNTDYDPTQAEQRYEKFCAEYLPSLPPYFALTPQTYWDKAISALHSRFSNYHTRFGVIIFNTFEASVLLLTVCTHGSFLVDQDEDAGQILDLTAGQLTRKQLMQAVGKGLDRLQTLAEVSDIAANNAKTLVQLFANASRDIREFSLLELDNDLGLCVPSESLNPSLMTVGIHVLLKHVILT
ncbi:hypothetical protein OCU04_012459 [Sclerotinia nivalis]|uniref:Xylanolytic transcriptional activator regulatory domain-containing protein n=1 Tax=Sclerotinia nivalis TaxID=352851 RepID=A0A9X0DCY8_9HELO|nr:hypothetical protein OCU04_012459 [Sclerotinia nivalis]